MLNFVKRFFFINWYGHVFFFKFITLNQPFILKIIHTRLWCRILFIHCKIWCPIIFEDFYVHVHERYWSAVFFPCVSAWLQYQRLVCLIKWVGKYFCFFNFLKKIVYNWCFFLKCLVDFASETIWDCRFPSQVFNYKFNKNKIKTEHYSGYLSLPE